LGDLAPANLVMSNLPDGQFVFSEASGDEVAQLNEMFTIDSSGTGFSGILQGCFRLEYDDAVGGTSNPETDFTTVVGLNYDNLRLEADTLAGFIYNNNTPYQPATQTIRLVIRTGTFTFPRNSFSTNYLSTLDNIPPELISARTLDPTHIEVTFDEQLTVPGNNGDAIDNWSLTSQGGTDYSVTAISNLGATTTTFTLTITPALNRSQRPLLNFAQQTDYQDLQGNPAATVNNLQAADGIPPGNIALFLGDDNNPFSVDDFIGALPIALIAHVDDGIASSDSALDGVLFQGSDNGSSWTNIGIATDEEIWGLGGDSAKYSITWDASLTTRQFKMIRAIAFDGGPNGVLGMNDLFEPGIDNSTTSNTIGEAADGNVISGLNKNFKDTYRFVISSVNPATIQAGTGDERSEITLAVQDNYGNLTNTTGVSNILRFSESSTSTESWWDAPTGGSAQPDYIEVNVSSTTTSASVWYSNTASGGPNTLALTEPAGNLNAITVNANGETISVTASGATRLLAALPGQAFQNGVGITGSPTSQIAGASFNMNLYIVDDGNNLALETSDRQIDFVSNASPAPDGTSPNINDQNSDNWTGIYIHFTDGVSDNIPVALYNAESGITFTANGGGLTGVQSSSISVDPGALGNFLFVMSSPQTDGFPVTGTNRVTARDNYNNIKTDFNASADNVTISGVQSGGGGFATLSGLSGGNILNQAGDFINGVADLTEDGLNIDVSQTGDYVFTAQTAGGATGSTGTINISTRLVTVSAPNTDADATIDASSSNTDLFLSASISGEEDPGLGDDFQINLAVNNTGVPGTYDLTEATGDLAVSGGTLSATIPAEALRQASGSRYLFWWIENMSTNPNATNIVGTPNRDTPRRLVINPT
ncbi:MAG: hypothetical protein P8184_21275, partial [Calditrichia bacterium]